MIKVKDETPDLGEELEISYDDGKTWESGAMYAENRTCMIAGSAGGHGYFGEGFCTSHDSDTDVGLILDEPTHWKYLNKG